MAIAMTLYEIKHFNIAVTHAGEFYILFSCIVLDLYVVVKFILLESVNTWLNVTQGNLNDVIIFELDR